MKPTALLDLDGYPTTEFLDFLRNYNPSGFPIMEFLEILGEVWCMSGWGYRLHKKYKGARKLELYTGGWSVNEEIINALLSNKLLFISMDNDKTTIRYTKWVVGGHYYFEIRQLKP